MDELQELINEWWGLLVQEHTDTRPLAHNLFWWIEEWMGLDFATVYQYWNGSPPKSCDGWAYVVWINGRRQIFDDTHRPIALMKAAIALAKRRKK